MRAQLNAALLAMALAIAPVSAMAQTDEIVVTASRYVDRYERTQIPQIAIVHRADFAVTSVSIESDTRDLALRRSELTETLREVERRTRNASAVTVALLEESEIESGETRVKPFTLEAAQNQITGGTRPDTSRLSILLRTPVSENDTLASVEERLDAFIRGVPKPGRVTVGASSIDLTVINPSQYRAATIAAIAADGRQILSAVGPGHSLRIEGLENRIAWFRSADLELTLYIPHRLQVVPAGVPHP